MEMDRESILAIEVLKSTVERQVGVESAAAATLRYLLAHRTDQAFELAGRVFLELAPGQRRSIAADAETDAVKLSKAARRLRAGVPEWLRPGRTGNQRGTN
jgi:hypothetical protein